MGVILVGAGAAFVRGQDHGCVLGVVADAGLPRAGEILDHHVRIGGRRRPRVDGDGAMAGDGG